MNYGSLSSTIAQSRFCLVNSASCTSSNGRFTAGLPHDWLLISFVLGLSFVLLDNTIPDVGTSLLLANESGLTGTGAEEDNDEAEPERDAA
jgi:hypothetical protein